MIHLVLVAVYLFIGIFFQRIKDFPPNSYIVLNQFVIYVSLPAIALIHIPNITLRSDLLFALMTAWLVLLLAVIIIPLLGKFFDWERGTVGCLILTAGFCNTSFVGFPVVEALYGPEALQIGLIVDQPGSFVAISSMGIVIASVYSAGKTRKRQILKQVLYFPPFIAFVIALIMNFANVQATGYLLGVLERLAATLAPVALISVGLQLKINMTGQSLIPLIFGLGYKLFIAPLFLFVLYILLLSGSGLEVIVSIMMAAMAPMVTGAILAGTYGLNPRLASIMVGIGIPLSFLTLALWYFFLEWWL